MIKASGSTRRAAEEVYMSKRMLVGFGLVTAGAVGLVAFALFALEHLRTSVGL